ncbi:MAG: neutral/alkaline non-lysosomal ceramidase N-terminal domain-containing protein, partial [Bacteroidota bacterium]
MNLKKILRFVLILIGAIIGLLLIFIAVTVGPLDRTPAQQLPSYDLTMARLDSLKGFVIPKAKTGFFVGYSKVNITPTSPLATAGYGNRKGKPFTHVHDSIYVRTLVFDNGTSRVAIVSADLLIVPPSVYELLQRKLPTIGFSLDNTYLGAIHTHNSIGHWGNGAAQFIYGGYRDSVVQAIADHIVQSITLASNNMLHATVRTGAVPIPEAVGNRLTDEGRVDSLLRVIEVQRSDGSKLLWTSYTAHATCLFSRDLFLSRDYPGKVVDKLEMQGYDFVMFMAGAVGSHGCKPPAFGESCIDW